MARNMETGGQRIFPTFQQIGDNLSNTGTSIVNSLPNKNELTKALRDPEFYSDVGSRAKNMFTSMHPMDQVALTTAPFPILGDVTGLAADARMFSQEPESRTPLNFGLSALGALPFIPAAATIKAFHGTPHKVDKFSMDKIGTGEGAQAYGHGLYFADSEDVARSYQKKLESRQFHNQSGNVYEPLDELQNMNVRATLEKTDGDIDAAINRANEVIKSIPGTQGAEFAKADIPILEKLKVDGGLTRPEGSLYNVNLNVNPEDLLDWDAPLSEQPESVRKILTAYQKETGGSLNQGKQLLNEISFNLRMVGKDDSMKAVSEELQKLGIPGLKYYDGMSRGRYGVMLKHKGKNYTDAPVEFATQKQADDYLKESIDKGFEAEHVDIGTRNYVMFDDNLINIVEPIDDIVNKHNAALDSVK
jgi:hypothetical protein